MKQYDLDDEFDTVANFLILSLQTEQILPQLPVNFFPFSTLLVMCLQFIHVQEVAAEFGKMDEKISLSMAKHNLTYLELLRTLAVDCDQFILFVRDKSFGGQRDKWPARYYM